MGKYSLEFAFLYAASHTSLPDNNSLPFVLRGRSKLTADAIAHTLSTRCHKNIYPTARKKTK
jgi:hypothetical protein